MRKIKKVGEEGKKKGGKELEKEAAAGYTRMFLAGVSSNTGGVFSSYNGRAEPEGSAVK